MSDFKFDLESVLANATEDIKQAAAKELKEQVISSIKWNMSDQIQRYATEWYSQHILPDIKAKLEADKELIIKTALDGISGIGDEIAKALSDKAKGNVKTSYKLSKIVDGLFG